MKTKIRRTTHDARKLTRTLAAATASTLKGGELAVASGEVVARRVALGAAALIDPAAADHREFTRMVAEKVTALSTVGAIVQQRSGAVMAEMTRFAQSEAALALEAAQQLARCRTPADLAAAQSRIALGWFARAASRSLAFGALAMRAGGAMLAPVHRAATANARRLQRCAERRQPSALTKT
jgi:Phasin protein